MNKRHPLAELIEHAQQLNDWSDRQLADRASSMDLDLSASNISRLKNREIVSIKGSVIRALALVLKVNEEKVARAALSSMGVFLNSDDVELESAVHASTDYSERDRRIILSVMSAMRESSEQPHDKHTHHHSPTGRERAGLDEGHDAGSGQKTGRPAGAGLDQMNFDLAAHPPMELERDRFDAEYGDVGEESQDGRPNT